MTTRRDLLKRLTQTSALGLLPLHSRHLLAETSDAKAFEITEVEVLRLTGPYTWTQDFNRQYQVQPIHLYPDLRPAVYKDGKASDAPGTAVQHYLRIKTRGGLEGLYGYIDPETVTPLLKQIRPFLLGKNAFAVEALWDQMYRNNRHSRAGHYMMALSAVDNALWDLRGRYLNMPVYKLLGGPTRKEARVYGSCLGYTVEKGKAGPRAKKLAKKGFSHQKWFLAFGPSDGRAGLRRNIELVEELRDGVGDDVQLMFDAFMGWDMPTAKAWVNAVAKYHPYWIEEAFATNRLQNFITLSKASPFPVATGEHFYNRWEALNYLQTGAIEIVQADPEWCGGVSELVKICHMASAFGAKVIPHGHNIHAALHVVASQSPDVCPLVEYLILHVDYKLYFQKNPPITDNGILALPTASGFGIEIDHDKIEKMEILTS